jgi:Asp-tRNA(Asn)/Glu-tRNA(Gln) amidotransferase C subunit
MESITPAMVAALAQTAGLALSPDELQALVPVVCRTLGMLERLESLPLASAEPATHYRIL